MMNIVSTSKGLLVSALINVAFTAPAPRLEQRQAPSDPFAPIDPQNWKNADNMTWDDYIQPPDTNWRDPSRRGYSRNFNIAIVVVDYPDSPFVVTLAPESDIFGNPQPIVSGLKREDVPAFYRDLLNTPTELNRNHTMHEYWMEDTAGKYGVDLTAFGPYLMPSKSYQYGIDDRAGGFNEGACPAGSRCSIDLRTDALGAWRAEVGNATADTFELAFILSAGQDESSTWQEFGEMLFLNKEDVPEEFGPPANSSLSNWADTRYVEWSSWAAAATIWPNAGRGSSTQGESSGMATFAHELSHLIGIGDNYNNPYGTPPRRAYTGPWSMLSRGSFNGPGGPHTRWQIPPLQGASMGSLHTVRDKNQLGLVDLSAILQISRSGLADSGLVVAELTARSIAPTADSLMGFNITFGSSGDLSPACNATIDPFCDGGAYDNYNVEVIDRMGSDSFCPDAGVMISKTQNSDRRQPFQWTIDANPQDIKVVDFYLPNGTAKYLTVGDYRQLNDALFHAGADSGSEFEYVDEANRLHFYILNINRDETGVLRYTVGVKSLDGAGPATFGANLSSGTVSGDSPAGAGVTCLFSLTNTGTGAPPSNSTSKTPLHPQDLSSYLGSDIYRLSASVDVDGWEVHVPNALATAKFGASTQVGVAVKTRTRDMRTARVVITAVSESDGTVKAEGACEVAASYVVPREESLLDCP